MTIINIESIETNYLNYLIDENELIAYAWIWRNTGKRNTPNWNWLERLPIDCLPVKTIDHLRRLTPLVLGEGND